MVTLAEVLAWAQFACKGTGYLQNNIIALMIIEMRVLWLVKDCIISCYNHLAQGGCNWSTKFQNGCLVFCQHYLGSVKHNMRKYNSEGTKYAAKFGITLWKKKIWSFCWWGEGRPDVIGYLKVCFSQDIAKFICGNSQLGVKR